MIDCVCEKKSQTSHISPAKLGEPILLGFCTTTQLRDVIIYSGRRLNIFSRFVFTGGRIFRFYRATRMHNADYAVAGCLSVCPSHAGILSKRLNISSNFFSSSGSHTILVFPYQRGWPYSNRTPPPWGCQMQGEYERNHDFRQISRFISEMIPDRAIITVGGE